MSVLVVDSSIWIEYGRETSMHPQIEQHLNAGDSVWTPATVIAEVAAYALKVGADIDTVVKVIGDYAHVEEVTGPLSRFAAEIHHERRKAHGRAWGIMQSYVLALARREGGRILTLDPEFADLKETIIPGGSVKRAHRSRRAGRR